MREKWIEIPLENGYKIFIDNNGDAGILVGLLNPNGYTVSYRTLTKEQSELLKEVTS